MSHRCVDHHEVELWGGGCWAHVVVVVTSARRCAVITFWDNWYSCCSCWRQWWRGRVMSPMERMLLLPITWKAWRYLVARRVPDSRAGTSRKGRSWRRDAKTIGNVCSCSRLFRIRRHWTDECVGPVLRMHYVAVSSSKRMPNTGGSGRDRRDEERRSQYRWWCTRSDNAHFRVN